MDFCHFPSQKEEEEKAAYHVTVTESDHGRREEFPESFCRLVVYYPQRDFDDPSNVLRLNLSLLPIE